MQVGVLMPVTQNNFFKNLNYFTGMGNTNLGTTLVSTLISGKTGLFLTPQGSSN